MTVYEELFGRPSIEINIMGDTNKERQMTAAAMSKKVR